MNTIDLKQFCSIDELRPTIQNPFSLGDYTYATDSRIAIRVPRREDINEVADAPKNIESLFKKYINLNFDEFDIPDVSGGDLIQCKECLGRGWVKECPDCEGEGEAFCDMGHHHECGTCDGDGSIVSTVGVGEECRACFGSGKVKKDTPIKIGCAYFSDRLLDKIKSLPNIRLHVGCEYDVATLSFEGGDGLLMPMRGADSQS